MSEYQVCTERDIEDVKEFTNRILRRQDPLAMLNLYEFETPKAPAESEVPNSASSYHGMSQKSVRRKKKKGGKLKRVILWILLLLTICALVMLLSALLKQTPYSTFKWLLP